MELDFQLTSSEICNPNHVFEVLIILSPANILFLLLTDHIILFV